MRVLVKVLMVLVIILAARHLTSNFGGEQRRKRDLERFDKKANYDGLHRWDGEGKEPSKGVNSDVDVLDREIDEEKGDTHSQIGVEKSDTSSQIDEEKGDRPTQIDVEQGDNKPLILLWNNYQGDKSALYNKIFHR